MTVIVCVVLVIVGVFFLWRTKRPALSEATKDLLKAAVDKNTTPRMIQNLINLGADVHAKDDKGNTALMLAAEYNSNPEVIRTLRKAGANIWVEDKYGRIVLDYSKTDAIKRIILSYAQ